jgi:hypothetical protein
MSIKTLKQLNKYLNQWVALSEPGEEIVGVGKNVIEAGKNAKKQGYAGEITFFKVFPFDQYIPSA